MVHMAMYIQPVHWSRFLSLHPHHPPNVANWFLAALGCAHAHTLNLLLNSLASFYPVMVQKVNARKIIPIVLTPSFASFLGQAKNKNLCYLKKAHVLFTCFCFVFCLFCLFLFVCLFVWLVVCVLCFDVCLCVCVLRHVCCFCL